MLKELKAELGFLGEKLLIMANSLERAAQILEENLSKGGERPASGLQIIKAQEEERKRIAREIHDGPGQAFANVIMGLEFCEKLLDHDPGKAKAELANLKELVRLNLEDIRRIIFDLRPMALDDLGLLPTLKGYLASFQERTGLEVYFQAEGSLEGLPSGIEIAIFRLIQEALNNIQKHAQANKAKIIIKVSARNIELLIEDNGCGFNLEETLANRKGFGLVSIKERVELLAGKINIQSAPGTGTKIEIAIPLGQEG